MIVSRIVKSYLHLSKVKGITKLIPKIPSNHVEKSSSSLEESITPRVSLSTSIRGCLLGIQLADSVLIKNPSLTLYLYKTVEPFIGVYNNSIIKDKLVFDAEVTQELWSLQPVKVELIAKVYPSINLIEEFDFVPISNLDIPQRYLNSKGKITAYVKDYKVDYL